MNRLTPAIERTRAKIETLDADKIARLEENTAIDFEEHFEFQQTQAAAHAMGKISTEEAQIIYSALGNSHSDTNGGWTKKTDLATKVMVMQIVGELLEMRLQSVK